MLKRFYQSKRFTYVIGFLYSLLFFYGYREILNGGYLYMGFTIEDHRVENNMLVLVTFLFAILPLIFRNGYKQISSFITIFLYLLLYVPIQFTIFFVMKGSQLEIMELQLLFCLGMSLLHIADRFGNEYKFYLPSNINIFKIVLFLTWLGTLYIGFKYRGNLRFVSYEDVYIQRSATEALGSDIITAYFGAWLANVFIPISAAYGLFSNKRLYFLSALLASIIFYMATADKAILSFPFIIYGLFKLLKNRSLNNAFSIITIGLSLVMIYTLNTEFSIFSALFWMRTLGNGGLLTVLYHDFFQHHPVTYYSHINFINALTHYYPYGDQSLGKLIGSEFFSDETNANANFWATDGFAAFGTAGILIASLLLFINFLVINKITKGYKPVFLLCIFVPYISSVLNQSLFSSFLTGGEVWLLFILIFKSSQNNMYINEDSNNNRG